MTKPTLQTLPAELRNNIYELVFIADEGPIDLTQASPPSKALTMTCRQMYNEANQIYRAAYRKFWRMTHFELRGRDLWTIKSKEHIVKRLKVEDIEHISRLKLVWTGGSIELQEGCWTYREKAQEDGPGVSVTAAGVCITPRGNRVIVWHKGTYGTDLDPASLKEQIEDMCERAIWL